MIRTVVRRESDFVIARIESVHHDKIGKANIRALNRAIDTAQTVANRKIRERYNVKAAAIRKALGLGKDTPGEIAKRLEMVVAGCISPVLTLPQAVKLAERFPIEFLTLTNEITELTGNGADLVKPRAASQTIPA